jgi:hypothetical protein
MIALLATMASADTRSTEVSGCYLPTLPWPTIELPFNCPDSCRVWLDIRWNNAPGAILGYSALKVCEVTDAGDCRDAPPFKEFGPLSPTLPGLHRSATLVKGTGLLVAYPLILRSGDGKSCYTFRLEY